LLSDRRRPRSGAAGRRVLSRRDAGGPHGGAGAIQIRPWIRLLSDRRRPGG